MKRKAYITSTGSYLPESILSNEMICEMVDTSDEWIQERCGVKERRILKDKDKATAYMAAEAAKKALQKGGISKDDIEVIIVATATPEHPFPSTASIVSEMLGIKRAFCFDVSAACSGFLYALNIGARLIESNAYKSVLVIGSDKMSSIMDYTNRNTCVLFGDGAGAVVLKPTNNGFGIGESLLETDGSGYQNLYQKAGGSLFPATADTVLNKEHSISMNGPAVFKMAVENMVGCCKNLLEKHQIQKSEIDYLIPHQANKRIITATADYLEMKMEKVALNIHKYGNTTCASIPICLDEWSSKFKNGDKLILCAFGAGYTYGSTLVTWNSGLEENV
ncbi:MAG: ketoacyl-ACP synthase III [Bacteroidia bacterium]|nr:ketoacyl-ACP synthase III [Bacteroidia bacterium]